MRVLLDTNVLIAAYFWNGQERAILWDCIRGVPDDAVERYLLLLGTFSTSVPPGDVRRISRDPKDNPIIAIALSRKVDALVTGDKDLPTLWDERRIFCFMGHCFKILRPGELK